MESGIYKFLDDGSIDGFYGTNIEISVIVGKNGSGKSSLLEIIFRMMNNLSAYIAHGVNIDSSINMVYVGGIYADLYYSIGKNEYVLQCRDKSLALLYKKTYIFCNSPVDSDSSSYSYGNMMTDEQKKELCKNLFFTLISNYSIQSYIEADYASEKTYRILDNGTLSEEAIGKVWLHSVFHKNDGYLSGININPFRDKGVIDMFREEKLERQRMQALLLHFQNESKDFIKGYNLSRIEYKFNWESLYDKFKKNKSEVLTEEQKKEEWNRIVTEFKKALTSTQVTIAKQILSKLLGSDFKDVTNEKPMLLYAYLYIVNKALSIANTYPSYSQYSDVIRPDATDSYKIEDSDSFFYNLAGELLFDHSHITNKIWQAINFIKKIDLGFECDESTSFTMDNYRRKKIGDELNRSSALENEIRCLPPSFFEYKIYLRKEDSEDEFPIESMSAGERQLYYIISTLVYHILNIKSVKEERVRYNNIAIVLDEVELGFHPEYQRKFICFLIETVERLKLSKNLGIHFLITTHSPFMLSDLRKSNILYIEDGKKIDKEDMLNPFGANINDILAQSFFLRNGFVGEFACKKILSLLDWLEGEENTNEEWNMVKAEEIVKSVGEPIIQNHLQNMVERKKEQLINEKDINK
ncbi:AAA family ATPase [Prevotella melaninogenica]|uniref:AAA family ATPase n=1 Tax=Prevotella melaninogenica TaxID=28132 RepID=UPI001C5E741C|nr:AAA family ATPase [Prevotella melaninogenica]MBW4741260.1 AAA family ATPase [Prevotella melaninogenica]MBW4913138.1 AAA family ATPase [Prevotella melaninogenica]